MFILKGTIKEIQQPRQCSTLTDGRKTYLRGVIFINEEDGGELFFQQFAVGERFPTLEVGKRYEVYFRLRSHTYRERWYTDLIVKQLTKIG